MAKDSIKIRTPKASDLNFIQATFTKCMKDESPLGRSCSSQVFFSEFPRLVDYLLDQKSVLVACDPESEDALFGYLIFDTVSVHFAYTKAALRRLDVARELIKSAFGDAKSIKYTLTTNSAKKIAEKYPELIHNPFPLFTR